MPKKVTQTSSGKFCAQNSPSSEVFERQATGVAACCGLRSGLSLLPLLLLPPAYKRRKQVADQLLNHPLPSTTVAHQPPSS